MDGIRKYRFWGAEGVGKTNLILRFVRDEFIEAHNLTLQGEQQVALEIDGSRCQVQLRDGDQGQWQREGLDNQRDQEGNDPGELKQRNEARQIEEKRRLKGETADLQEWGYNGVFLVFALDEPNTYWQSQQLARLIRNKKRCKFLLIGNKSDLKYASIVQNAMTLSQLANNEAGILQMKYLEVSAKNSSKAQIERIFVEMINQTEMAKFIVWKMRKKRRLPCCEGEGHTYCAIV